MSTERSQFAVAGSPRNIIAGGRGLLLLCAMAACASPTHMAAQKSVAKEQPPTHPIAQSRQEREDFNRAYALTAASAAENAANDFSTRYRASQLRRYLYSNAMLQYQRENNPAKMLEMGEKVLGLDPDNPLALVLTATAVADSLAEHDRDREHKVGIVKRNAARAIQVAETSYPSSADSPSVGLYRTTLQSMAYSARGIVELKTGDDAEAEKDLRVAADLAKVRPDPYIWYHLALAQDHRKKYTAALNSVEQALQLASSNPELQKLAEAEHERLFALAKSLRNAEPE